MSAKFEIHFHAPVGQNINNVEHMDVHVGKDGKVQVMNAEQVTTDSKPTEETKNTLLALDKVFTFKYRQELGFSLLVDFLAEEKNRTDFYADSDWARYALTIYEWAPCVLQKRPNTFKEWLPKFCELFGRPFVRDYEPNKLQFARENKIIPFLPLKETR